MWISILNRRKPILLKSLQYCLMDLSWSRLAGFSYVLMPEQKWWWWRYPSCLLISTWSWREPLNPQSFSLQGRLQEFDNLCVTPMSKLLYLLWGQGAANWQAVSIYPSLLSYCIVSEAFLSHGSPGTSHPVGHENLFSPPLSGSFVGMVVQLCCWLSAWVVREAWQSCYLPLAKWQ